MDISSLFETKALTQGYTCPGCGQPCDFSLGICNECKARECADLNHDHETED